MKKEKGKKGGESELDEGIREGGKRQSTWEGERVHRSWKKMRVKKKKKGTSCENVSKENIPLRLNKIKIPKSEIHRKNEGIKLNSLARRAHYRKKSNLTHTEEI